MSAAGADGFLAAYRVVRGSHACGSRVVLFVVNRLGIDARLVVGAHTALFLACLSTPLSASDEAILQAKTARDFGKYVAAVESRSISDIKTNQPFLEIDRKPAAERARIMTMLSRGEVYVERGEAPRDGTAEIEIDGGSVNHWRGTVLIPHVTLDQLLKVLQEPQTDQHKQEDVLASRVVNRDGDTQKVYLRLKRTKFVTVIYDTEYDVEYKRLSSDRAYSNSISTKVVEVENAGTPRERTLPEGNDHGYMWRLNSYWRYQQLGDGVVVQVESLTLSRNLPPIIGPLISPIVTSIARETMARSLASVRARFTH